MQQTIEATQTTTATVSTAMFRAWRKWLYANMFDHHNWRRAIELGAFYNGLGHCAGAALDAAMEEWRRSGGGDWKTLPVSAVKDAGGVFRDDETFKGNTVELAYASYGGDPEELVARVVAVSGIADE